MAPKNRFSKGGSPNNRASKTASIRGKISAPIPFPDPLDDEYHARTTGQIQSPVRDVTTPLGSPVSAMPVATPLPMSIPEDQPITMPIVPNSTLDQAIASGAPTSAPPPPPTVRRSGRTNSPTAASFRASTSPSPSPVPPPIDISQQAPIGPLSAPLPLHSRPLPTPSPTLMMNAAAVAAATTTTTANNNANAVHGRSFSQTHPRREPMHNGVVGTGSMNGRSLNPRGRPPLSAAIIRTSAAISFGNEQAGLAQSTMSQSSASSIAPTHGRADSQAQSIDYSLPQRKKSTLRSAIGKIFGKKRGRSHSSRPSDATSIAGSAFSGAEQLQTSPQQVAMARRTSPIAESKRSISLPAHERNSERGCALRSHSIGPRDIVAIESARNSLSLEAQAQAQLQAQIDAIGAPIAQIPPSPLDPPHAPGFVFKRRAASTGGEFFIPPRNIFSEPSGLSPRPTSSQCRSRTPREDDGDIDEADETGPEEIGKAITSQEVLRNRRRSRSVPGIALDLSTTTTVVAPVTERRRSDEIRYWRQSYAGTFVHSPVSEAGPLTAELPPEPSERPPSPPQPFNFGPLATMKITEAASFESRVGDVESRVCRLEKSMQTLHEIMPGFRLTDDGSHLGLGSAASSGQTSTTLVNGDRGMSSRDSQMILRPPSSRRSEDSHMSFGQAPTFTSSLHAAPAPAARAVDSRGPTKGQSLAQPINDEQYNSLVALIESERAARLTLEAEVRRLARALHANANATGGSGAAGPTSSVIFSGSLPARNFSLHHRAPPSRRSMVASVFGDDEGMLLGSGTGFDDEASSFVPAESMLSDHDDEDEDDDDEADAPHTIEAFGGSQRKTTRTLSLSQLTLATKPQFSEKQLEYEAEQMQHAL